jgi:TMEM175 potassium channel family protein
VTKHRLEAFSDGVIAILITIMVLELRPPADTSWAALRPVLPHFLSYVLSFVYLAIYWNNHHHLLQAVHSVNGRILWANVHLLFWLSLVPFVTSWMAGHLAPRPVAAYGVVLVLAGAAYRMLTIALISHHGSDSTLAHAIGSDFKGKISVVLYGLAIAAAFLDPRIACAIYVLVALVWLVPDRRIEQALKDSRLER